MAEFNFLANTQYSRSQQNRTSVSGVTPTIYSGSTSAYTESDLLALNQLASTDILDGEFYLNTNDKKVFARLDSTIIEFSTSINSGDTNTYTTGATLVGSTAYFNRNDSLSAYTLNLSGIASTQYWTAGTGTDAIVQRNSNSLASGTLAISEGNQTSAVGNFSHAEGIFTSAIGSGTHTEGYLNTGFGTYSHTGGEQNITSGIDGFTHSSGSTNTGNYSAILGGKGNIIDNTTITGTTILGGSFITGTTSDTVYGVNFNASGSIYSGSTNLLNIFSTSTGQTSYWSAGTGSNSIVQKNSNGSASGTLAVVEGLQTTASGDYSHGEGRNTAAFGEASHAEGYNTVAFAAYSHAQGQATTSSGLNSHAAGINSIASGITSFVHSSASTVNGNNSSILGGRNNIINASITGSTILGGSNITGTTSDTAYVPNLNITNTLLRFGAAIASGGYVNHLGSGVFQIADGTGFGSPQLILGSLASSNGFRIKRTATSLDIRVGDDSGYGNIGVLTSRLYGNSNQLVFGSANTISISSVAPSASRVYTLNDFGANATIPLSTSGNSLSFITSSNTSLTLPVSGTVLTDASLVFTASSGSNAAIQRNSNSLASGTLALAVGTGTTASGNYSHTQGSGTTASAVASHAEGVGSIASGTDGAHAEGWLTSAGGDYGCHAEGHRTTAIGNRCHAEGGVTTAAGDASHAEGFNTKAIGNYAHTEGYATTASASEVSHAEGRDTLASGNYSHAGGQLSIASGIASRAIGRSTLASGNYSHAEGNETYSVGQASHSQGQHTRASGLYSHTGGFGFNNNTNRVSALGLAAFNHSSVDVNHPIYDEGATGDYSAILGGLNNYIRTGATHSAILGGKLNKVLDNITGTTVLGGSNLSGLTNDTVVVPTLVIQKPYTPTGTTDTVGTYGAYTFDDSYVYVKTSAGWKRSSLTTF